MTKDCKVCLTTYVYGEKYQWYIPMLAYSCHKAYPEYDIILFLHENLNPQIREIVSKLNIPNIVFVERKFSDCPQMNALKAKSLRWVLWDESFNNYDYLYVIDIDMFYIREPKPLHIQHIEHMSTTNLPYDNISRCFIRKPFKWQSIAYRVKHAGLLSFHSFLFGDRKDRRASGLHFISVKEYFSLLDNSKREMYKHMIYDGSYLKLCMSCNNEAFLFQILKETNLCPERMAVQTQSYKMLDFNDNLRAEFRPHHGIHMGIFRSDMHGKRKTILDSETYQFYITTFKKDILSDDKFKFIIENSPAFIKNQFSQLFDYYAISRKEDYKIITE